MFKVLEELKTSTRSTLDITHGVNEHIFLLPQKYIWTVICHGRIERCRRGPALYEAVCPFDEIWQLIYGRHV